LEVSRATYLEIYTLLAEAGYHHAFIDGAIDMKGIALTMKREESKVDFPDRAGSKPSRVAQLEAILDQDEDVELEILPNGEVRALGGSSSEELGDRKPLTWREDLGGEYGR
jgi:hypothetical protein